jgi:hypothetical protein
MGIFGPKSESVKEVVKEPIKETMPINLKYEDIAFPSPEEMTSREKVTALIKLIIAMKTSRDYKATWHHYSDKSNIHYYEFIIPDEGYNKEEIYMLKSVALEKGWTDININDRDKVNRTITLRLAKELPKKLDNTYAY